jgi:hypothetical protein
MSPQPGEIWLYRFEGGSEDNTATVIVVEESDKWDGHYMCFGLESGELDGWSFEPCLIHNWERLA